MRLNFTMVLSFVVAMILVGLIKKQTNLID